MLLCRTLHGNGILDTMQLERKIMLNLLCLQCVQDKKRDIGNWKKNVVSECAGVVCTIHLGWACTLTIECSH